MDEQKSYVVEITTRAEKYYLDVLEYLLKFHTTPQARKKGLELLELAQSLKENPYRGAIEPLLTHLGCEFRFLTYQVTQNKTIKVIYFVHKDKPVVYVTDFFPTTSNPDKISHRTKA